MSVVPALDLHSRPSDDMPAANMEAEQALLGCVLFDNEAYHRINGLGPEHFYEPLHARLFDAMAQHIRKGQLAEPIVLKERFARDEGFNQLGGILYLADLIDRAPPTAHAQDYARIIVEQSRRRELMRLAGDIARSASDPEVEAAETITLAEAELYKLAEVGSASTLPKSFDQCLAGAVEMIAAAYAKEGEVTGLSTGLVDLDRKLAGLHPSDLVIVAGRPSMGKTALATNIAFHIASRYQWEPAPDGSHKTLAGGRVLFFSLEMSEEQLAMRILAEVSGISGDRLRKGEIDLAEFGRIRDAAHAIQSSPLFIDATPALSIEQIAARARRQKRTSGLDLIVVDYLQLATSPSRRGEGRVQEVSEITQGLKALAKALDVPVLALSQLSRKVEDRDDKKPQLADLRESGSIEQDADVVAFVYRESYYLGRQEPKPGSREYDQWLMDMEEARGVAEVIIGKQRHGPIGTVRLSFNDELTKFGNLARESRFEQRMPYGDH